MADNESGHLNLETRVKGDDVQIVVNRGAEKFGRLVLNNQTVCWIPEESTNPDEPRKMTWLMPWEHFARAMQSIDLGDIGRFDQAAYVPASRVSAPEAEGNFGSPMPDAREALGLNRRFNNTEFALIRKGFPPEWDAHWGMYFDPVRSELRMCRSWTGFCIYTLTFREDSHGAEITESWVNRDKEQYESTNTEHDAELASWLIDAFLLGKRREFPSESTSDDEG